MSSKVLHKTPSLLHGNDSKCQHGGEEGKKWGESSCICFASKYMAGILPPAEGTWLLLREVLFPFWENLLRNKGHGKYG